MARGPALDDSNDAALAEWLDELLVGDPELRRLSAGIRRLQRMLRQVIGDDGWAAYLDVEEAHNDRLDAALKVVARRAYEAGRISRS